MKSLLSICHFNLTFLTDFSLSCPQIYLSKKLNMANKLNNESFVAYSESAIRNNLSIVEYCRTSVAAVSGCTAGVLGLTGLYGALFFILAVTSFWFMLLGKAGLDSWKKFFISRKSLLLNGILGHFFTYILCWTFIYGMVHVY